MTWRTTAAVLLVWTAGILVIWFLSDVLLNPGVSEADIQECMEEEFIAPQDCEETLESLEEEDPAPIRPDVAFLVWAVGSALLAGILRPRG